MVCNLIFAKKSDFISDFLDSDINKSGILSAWTGIQNLTGYWNVNSYTAWCEHTTPRRPWMCKGISEKLTNTAFLLPCCQFASGKAASHYGTVTALPLPCGLCSCCFWRRQRLLCCLSRYTHKRAASLIAAFLSDGLHWCSSCSPSRFKKLCPFLTQRWNVQLGIGLAALQWIGSAWVHTSLLCCDVEQDARRKRTYLALTVIILPLLNGNAFGRVFSIQLAWFVVLFWRLNVVYNQRLLQ